VYLIIDTSTHNGAVGLWREGVLFRTVAWSSRNNHTAELMPAVDALLGTASAVPGGLAGLIVARGPGGFSALRAGFGVAKGLAFSVSLPIAGISSLEATAYPFGGLGMPVCPLIGAGRGLVAWARFQRTDAAWLRRTPDRVTSIEALLAARGRHMLFCGEATHALAEDLREAMGDRAHIVEPHSPGLRLEGLAALGAARLDNGDADPIASLRPHYLRAPSIGQPRVPQPQSLPRG
jgi:tRNA threonylcarbamoyladenosine biosynthesis protein TsaB